LRPVEDGPGQELKVSVKLPTGNVYIQVWKLDVGRITLYLLDTNIPENVLPQDRDITDSLYGGDIDTRIRQEFVLGIGGMRALQAMGLKPTVFHMNEGHSAFLALEQVRHIVSRFRDAQQARFMVDKIVELFGRKFLGSR
jgi:starch phosphorylase